MSHATDYIATTLKFARKAKGLSQRALGRLADVPQGHISKIENGAVDLRVSSLAELARVLDLELTLVPRNRLTAVNSIVRSTGAPRQPAAGVEPAAFPMPTKVRRACGIDEDGDSE